HARVFVVFDMATRWLRASGYDVEYVRNITDIDDKIIKRAAENSEAPAALTERFIHEMHQDERALGVLPPDHEPRATAYVAQMLALIGQLVDKGLAYPAPNGDVYYSVRAFPAYGRLSGKSLDELRAGERVEIDAAKRDPLDFVLWKAAKAGEPAWESPWGAGRPGWHIECSAMSADLLGKHFDIHGGGQDLQFPHHENEIAQSEGAHDCTFVNYWMHNGFVRVDNEKMSKSLGNFFTIREVLQQYDAEVVRFFILRAHYRSPLNYSDAHLDDAKSALTRLYTALKNAPLSTTSVDWAATAAQAFKVAMDDDFNTPEALAVLFELASAANRGDADSAQMLRNLGGVLGLLQRDTADFLKSGAAGAGLSEAEIDAMIVARRDARAAKNFAESDRIRDALLAAGIVLEDGAGGTVWRRA
ncbi:MAG: cysteine--tRNA ligase, partial [Thiobacillus sp.]|nr:cysteine--tRNA ligase [Thiobacillus sp.]